MRRILLLLDQKENQKLLAEELAPRHDVVIAVSDDDIDTDFDLCFVDGASLDRIQHRVRQKKEDGQPIFLPFLLITSRPDVKMITRHVWRVVDELIVTPIEKPELRARVEILLRARSLSLALQQRAEVAELATRTRDEVLAMVSHDLRNPLGVVLASASFLIDSGDLPSAPREQLRIIHRAAGQMNSLVADLLEVAAIEAGHLPVARKHEPVEPLLRDAHALCAHDADARSITLTCTATGELPDVCVDHDRILQVFANLIGNAIKFTPEGGTVSVSAERDGDFVAFSVSDTGAGISEGDLPHVFDRFWQAGHAQKGGAGLGLAIVKGIVAAHGGTLSAASTVGEGSTFTFTLPADS